MRLPPMQRLLLENRDDSRRQYSVSRAPSELLLYLKQQRRPLLVRGDQDAQRENG
jgi:hypothetical protein